MQAKTTNFGQSLKFSLPWAEVNFYMGNSKLFFTHDAIHDDSSELASFCQVMEKRFLPENSLQTKYC